MRSDVYDDFAERYDRENGSSLLNEYYERPAMLDLAGDVAGLRTSPSLFLSVTAPSTS